MFFIQGHKTQQKDQNNPPSVTGSLRIKKKLHIVKFIHKSYSLISIVCHQNICSFLYCSKFGPSQLFLCSDFSVITDLLFHFLPCIMTNCLFEFNVLEGNGRSRIDKQHWDHRILLLTQWLISRPQFKSRPEFTRSKFSSLEK